MCDCRVPLAPTQHPHLSRAPQCPSRCPSYRLNHAPPSHHSTTPAPPSFPCFPPCSLPPPPSPFPQWAGALTAYPEGVVERHKGGVSGGAHGRGEARPAVAALPADDERRGGAQPPAQLACMGGQLAGEGQEGERDGEGGRGGKRGVEIAQSGGCRRAGTRGGTQIEAGSGESKGRRRQRDGGNGTGEAG
ncbi:unnamed protein product [Closterium sp. NIES-54]